MSDYPLFYLYKIIGINNWFLFFWFFHSVIAYCAVFFLMRLFHVEKYIAHIGAATFILSMPSINYSLTDDWPSGFFTWTLFPVVIYLFTNIFLKPENNLIKILSTGLIFGIWIKKSHPGHLVSIIIPLSIYLFFLVLTRPKKNTIISIILGVVSFLIFVDPYYFYFVQATEFPSTVIRFTQGGLSFKDYANSVIYPFYNFSTKALCGSWNEISQNVFSRGPCFGMVFMILSLLSPIFYLKEKMFSLKKTAPFVALISAYFLSTSSPSKYTTLFSGMWLSRDAFIMFGILVCGILLKKFINSPFKKYQNLGFVFLMTQNISLFLGYLPVLCYFILLLGLPERFAHKQGYQSGSLPAKLQEWLEAQGVRQGDRIIFSSYFESVMRNYLFNYGIHGYTDFVRNGYRVSSGWFKNVSMDKIYPSDYLMHGRIKGDQLVLNNDSFLSVTGIKWLITSGEEKSEIKNKLQISKFFFSDLHSILLFKNEAQKKEAFILKDNFDTTCKINQLADKDVPASRKDFSGLLDLIQPVDTRVIRTPNKILVKYEKTNFDSILFVPEFLHQGWSAFVQNTKIDIFPVGGAFIGARVPAYSTEVEFKYFPVMQTGFFILSTLTQVVLLAVILFLLFKNAKRNKTQPI